MAKKDGLLKLHAPFLGHIAVMLVIGAGLMVFQQLCLNNPYYSFLTGDVCMGESYSHALIAAALTIATAVIGGSVTRAAVAFRTAKLSTGIPEGVFIACGSNALWNSYTIRAIAGGGRWAAPVVVYLAALHSQNAVQTAVNLGIQVSQVYVPNSGTANVYDTVSFYNVTDFRVAPLHVNEGVAVLTLSKMQQYRNSAVSTLVNETVVTNAIRDNYINTVNHTVEDVTNAFRREEVVATLGSTCTLIDYDDPVSGLITNSTFALNVSFSPDFAGVYVYDAKVSVISPNQLVIKSLYTQPTCTATGQCQPLLPSAPVRGVVAECLTTVTLAVQEIVYTVSSDNAKVTQFRSNDTTVDINIFAGLMTEYAAAPEGAAVVSQSLPYESGYIQVITSFPNGIFNAGQPNVLHARFCAAASLALSNLWFHYGRNANNTGNATTDATIGNAFGLYDRDIPLYNLVIQTYVSTLSMILIVSSLVGFTLLVCAVGITYAQLSPINLKQPLDTSILPNVDDEVIARQRLTGSSNNPQLQCQMAFDPAALLFCREATTRSPPIPDPFKGHRDVELTAQSHVGAVHETSEIRLMTAKRISITYGTAMNPPSGVLPNSTYDYH